jgi:hypothetical protein
MRLEKVGRGYEFNIWFLEKDQQNHAINRAILQGDESGALSITSDKVRAASQPIAYQEITQQLDP